MTARVQLQVGDGPKSGSDRRMHGWWGERGQSRTEVAHKEPAHGCQWSREGHPDAAQREQAKPKYRRAKTEYQNREEWGYHAPNYREMESWNEDRAKTSQPAGRCRVEEQVLEEQGG